jgi:RNA polymerase sigma-70 factor (ECF subfamily)
MSRNPPAGDGDVTAELSALVQSGDQQAFGRLLERFRERLLRVIKFRMDQRLYGRIDPDDVLQEAYLEASQRLASYAANPTMPFFVWLRFIAVQRLLALHRHHLQAQVRDAEREISLFRGPLPGATSEDLAARLLGSQTSPSQAIIRAEQKMKLEAALNSMEPIDREVLALRHFEQLSNVEVAEVLGLNPTAASNRYVRAIKRLRTILEPLADSTHRNPL